MKIFASALLFCASCTLLHIGPVEVESTGGAGFAGLRTYELLQQPAFSTPPRCVSCQPVQVLDSVDLVPNHHYQWRPALSTGVAFQHYQTTGGKVGGGLGLNMVVLSDDKGLSSAWPAITMHYGTRENGFFFGLVISPTDGIIMPGGVATLRVPRDHIPDLIAHNTGRAGHLYMGIRLGGKSVTVGDSTK